MRHESLHFTCNACELGTGPVDSPELAEEDNQLPPGWAEIVIRRKIPNPGKALEAQERETAIAEYTAVLKQAASEPGKQWTMPEVAQLRAVAEQQIDASHELTEPAYVVEEIEGHLCAEHVMLLGDLGFDEFAPVGGQFVPPPKPAQPVAPPPAPAEPVAPAPPPPQNVVEPPPIVEPPPAVAPPPPSVLLDPPTGGEE